MHFGGSGCSGELPVPSAIFDRVWLHYLGLTAGRRTAQNNRPSLEWPRLHFVPNSPVELVAIVRLSSF